MKAAFLACVALFGFALSAAACSDLNQCSSSASAGAGGTSCSSDNASAGSGGSGGSTATCSAWTAVQSCFTTFCRSDGAGTPFCNCFLKGYNLSAPLTDANGNETGCACVKFDVAQFCTTAAANGNDGSSTDCSAATGQVATMCVGVQ